MDIMQGYLSLEKERVVRVRIEGEKGWLTVKGKSKGATQPEYEYQIPVADARSILENLRDGELIEKTRYRITYKGVVWEVDDFKGENSGLVIAEVEGESEEELETAVKNKPDWIGEEITSKYEFRNVNLAKHPYTTWRGKGNV